MSELNHFNIEELKTATGYLMADLRYNWGYDYVKRMEQVVILLEALIKKDEDNKFKYESDLETTLEVIEEQYDGRVFRDNCILYNYNSADGKTQRVKEYIETYLTHPESNSFEV